MSLPRSSLPDSALPVQTRAKGIERTLPSWLIGNGSSVLADQGTSLNLSGPWCHQTEQKAGSRLWIQRLEMRTVVLAQLLMPVTLGALSSHPLSAPPASVSPSGGQRPCLCSWECEFQRGRPLSDGAQCAGLLCAVGVLWELRLG